MNNGDKASMPISVSIGVAGDLFDSNDCESGSGLTKREMLAAMAMQGFITAGHQGMSDGDKVASLAVEYANALLKALSDEGDL